MSSLFIMVIKIVSNSTRTVLVAKCFPGGETKCVELEQLQVTMCNLLHLLQFIHSWMLTDG